MESPFFSIITINLNSGAHLRRTCESVFSQSSNDFEYIVKDGLSNDGSIDFLINYKDKIKLIEIKDCGIYDAMNQALELINGKYILFLNAGDEFVDENILQNIKENCSINNSAKLIYTDYIIKGNKIKYKSPSKLLNYTLFRNMLCHQACYFSADLIRNERFNLKYKVVADYEFFLRLLKNRINYLYIPIVSVEMLPGGFSSQNKNMAIKETNEVRKIYFGKMFYIFSIINFITLPSLRYRLSTLKGFSVIYKLIVNFLNKFL